MLYLTDHWDIFEEVCQRRYQPRTKKELNYFIQRVFHANRNSPSFSMITPEPTSCLLSNHLIWLPDEDLDKIDYATVQDHEEACDAVNYSPAWNRLQLYDLLNSPLDMYQVMGMAYVHQDVRHYQLSKKGEEFAMDALDQGTEYYINHIEKLVKSMEGFNDLLKNILSDSHKHHRTRLSASERKALKEAYEVMHKKYVGAIRYAMGFVGRSNLLVHRDPWRMKSINKQHTFWETTQDQLRTLGEGLRFAKMASYGNILLELGIDSYDVYSTYKNHGDWHKELVEDIGEWLGGIAGAGALILIGPETLFGAMLLGGALGLAGSEIFSSLLADIYDEYDERAKNF